MPGIPIGAIDNLKARLKKIFKKKEKAPKEAGEQAPAAKGDAVAAAAAEGHEPAPAPAAEHDVDVAAPSAGPISDAPPVISADPPEIAPIDTTPGMFSPLAVHPVGVEGTQPAARRRRRRHQASHAWCREPS
jgi:hypothetical protein